MHIFNIIPFYLLSSLFPLYLLFLPLIYPHPNLPPTPICPLLFTPTPIYPQPQFAPSYLPPPQFTPSYLPDKRVSAGLDSLIVGEGQILAQV